ncbi:MAG: hypothetical protein KDC27_12985 [Acidobacteria bacterium]|nr:hypothetical protein [Acidobacteriota bacterium]
MRIDLNLATKPFGRARLFWTISGVAAAMLALVAAGLGWTYYANQTVSPETEQARIEIQRELSELGGEEATLSNDLRQASTIDLYDRSFFLNQLLTRKGVSWQKTFEDVEQVLPPRVLMMQIRPEVTFENKIDLEMQVGAESLGDFIEFVTALEKSKVFGPPRVRGYNPPNENEPYHRYLLSVSYDQQL